MASQSSIGILIALDETLSRVHISEVPDDLEQRHLHDYTCPICRQPLVAKKGKKNAHHFAHAAGTKMECDDWYAGMSDWHFGWQQAFPVRNQEVVFDGSDEENKAHRADIYLPEQKTVVEFQHSPMSDAEFERRNRFYARDNGRCVWVFDVRSKASSIEIDANVNGAPTTVSLVDAYEIGGVIDWSKITWKNAPAWIRPSAEKASDASVWAAGGVQVFLAVRGTDAGANGILLQVRNINMSPSSPVRCDTVLWHADKWIEAVKCGSLPIQNDCHILYVSEGENVLAEDCVPQGAYARKPPSFDLPWYAERRVWFVNGVRRTDVEHVVIEEDSVFKEKLVRRKALLKVHDLQAREQHAFECRCLDRLSEIDAASHIVNDGCAIIGQPVLSVDAIETEIRIEPKIGMALDNEGTVVFAASADKSASYKCMACGKEVRLSAGYNLDGEQVPIFRHVEKGKLCRGWNDEIAVHLVYSALVDGDFGQMTIPETCAVDCTPHKSRWVSGSKRSLSKETLPPQAPSYGRFAIDYSRAPDLVVAQPATYDLADVQLKEIEYGLNRCIPYIEATLSVNDKTSSLAIVVSVRGIEEKTAIAFRDAGFSVVHVFLGGDMPLSNDEFNDTVRKIAEANNIKIEWLWNRAAERYARKRLHLAFGLSGDNDPIGYKIENILRGWNLDTTYVSKTSPYDAVAIMSGEHLSLAESFNEYSGKTRVHYYDADVYLLLLPGTPADNRVDPVQLPGFVKLIRQAAKKCIQEKSARIDRK